jgi:hypothetical protein
MGAKAIRCDKRQLSFPLQANFGLGRWPQAVNTGADSRPGDEYILHRYMVAVQQAPDGIRLMRAFVRSRQGRLVGGETS